MFINPLLETIYQTGIVEAADGFHLQAFPAGVCRELAEALYQHVRQNRPKRTLEIGMAYGISSLAICQGLRDNGVGHHTAIDPMQTTGWKSIGALNLKRAGLDGLFEIKEEPSQLVLPDFVRGNQVFDFVFVDGSHLFDFVMVDLFYVRQLLPIGGLLCADDMTWPSVSKALAFVLSNWDDLTVIEQTKQWIVLQKMDIGDGRHWTHFVPF